MVWGAIIAAGISIAASYMSDDGTGSANSANSALNAHIKSLFREMGQREAIRFAEAKVLFQGRADRVLGDMDRAAAGVGSSERTARRGASDRNERNTASLTQGIRRAGFKNSTIGANLQRGVNDNFERNLSNITAQADRARTGIATTKAGFRAQVEGDLANLPLLRNSSEQNRLLNFTKALAQMGHVAQGGRDNSGALGALGGSLFSAFGGGWGGGSMGNSFNSNFDGNLYGGTFA